MSWKDFPRRMIHLDFHTGPDIPDVGKDFNPEEFARTFKEAHADSVTVFAKCHHGLLYYDTDRPERHPNLPRDLNLLGEQIDALHRVGIRAPIYISLQCDEYAANTHPEWRALDADNKIVKHGGAFTAGWQIMDMSSPFQDYFAEQLDEVLKTFGPIDGMFIDMCWDQPGCSKWAIDGMLKAGLDPKKEEDRNRYAREVAMSYMARYHQMIDPHLKYESYGVWFNSRPKTNLYEEKQFLRHIEVESLPTGGWGYAYFPYVSRFVRPLNLPTLSHTGRFFKSWGDNSALKPEMALKYECSQILSQGITSGIGDLLHPYGAPNKTVYDLIGKVYGHIEACEPYVEGGRVKSQIALIVDPELGDHPGPSGVGATRALQQLQQQFDVVPPEALLDEYELVIVAETAKVDASFCEKLSSCLAKGAALIVSGRAAVDDNGKPILKELGIKVEGKSPYTHTFLHAGDEVGDGIPEYPHVIYEQGFRMKPAAGAQSLAMIGEPFFQREYQRFSGHDYTTEEGVSDYAAVVRNGQAITFSFPVMEAYGRHAYPVYRDLLGNCITLLMPEPLVKIDGPTVLETTVVESKERTVVHLLSFNPERRAEGLDIIEDAFPLVDVPVSVKLGNKPSRVYMAPDEKELDFEYSDGYARARITMTGGHGMLVFDK